VRVAHELAGNKRRAGIKTDKLALRCRSRFYLLERAATTQPAYRISAQDLAAAIPGAPRADEKKKSEEKKKVLVIFQGEGGGHIFVNATKNRLA
jgi:hypothetical protein